MNEMNFSVSESITRKNNLNYILDTTLEVIKKLNGRYTLDCESERAILKLGFPPESLKLYEPLLADKIGDIIAVNYKYIYFTRYIRTGGLSETDYEMLIAALISADIEEDKRYVINGITTFNDFSIDGYFNFRLKLLKEKWGEIVTYIPSYFTKEKLSEFISYIVCEKTGKKAFVYENKVYDSHFNRMLKSNLTRKISEANIVREIILSGFGEVELNSTVSETDEKYLVSFFGDKIFFKKGKIR